jgi:hypothetical protein
VKLGFALPFCQPLASIILCTHKKTKHKKKMLGQNHFVKRNRHFWTKNCWVKTILLNQKTDIFLDFSALKKKCWVKTILLSETDNFLDFSAKQKILGQNHFVEQETDNFFGVFF